MQDDLVKDATGTASSTIPRERGAQDVAPGEKQVSMPPIVQEANTQGKTVFFHPSLNMWVVTRYKDVTAALKDHDHFSSALCYDMETAFDFLEMTPEAREVIDSVIPFTTLQMAGTDRPDHTRLRNSLSKAFRPRRIEQLEARIQRISDRLVDQFINDGRADLVKQFTYPLPVLSILSLIGIPEQDTEQIKSWCADWTALMFNKLPAPQQLAYAHSLRAFHQYLINLIAL
ncbi:MAG TPA: hypothetical protein VH593_30245, partial [Ktedonobacteraceae bacterium]